MELKNSKKQKIESTFFNFLFNFSKDKLKKVQKHKIFKGIRQTKVKLFDLIF